MQIDGFRLAAVVQISGWQQGPPLPECIGLFVSNGARGDLGHGNGTVVGNAAHKNFRGKITEKVLDSLARGIFSQAAVGVGIHNAAQVAVEEIRGHSLAAVRLGSEIHHRNFVVITHQQQIGKGIAVILGNKVVAQLFASCGAGAGIEDGVDIRESGDKALPLAVSFQRGNRSVKLRGRDDQIVIVFGRAGNVILVKILGIDEEISRFNSFFGKLLPDRRQCF